VTDTPETDAAVIAAGGDWSPVLRAVAQRLERQRDEVRADLREWQTLCLWGGTPEHIHDFIKGQQTRIHEAQDIEKTCEQLERERDEARNQRDILRLDAQREAEHHDRMVGELERVYAERDEALGAIRALAEHGESEIQRLTKERVEAREALMKIEEVFIDGDDTYEDWRKMGCIARAALEKKMPGAN
jgi:hypothetical protein